jgi:MerR family transcriptional regulator, light-induced transcriptional regulator
LANSTAPADDGRVSDAAPDDEGAGTPEPRLTVAAVARRLGVAPATLRTWDRRYGLGPTLHAAGAHRRYSRIDIARLEAMRRLVLDGVPPADAARIAIDQVPGDLPVGGPPGPSGQLSASDEPSIVPSPRPTAEFAAGGPGGRVLAVPGADPAVRGLARAAMALDTAAVRESLERFIEDNGVIAAWDDLLRPVLVAAGNRWAVTGEGIEVEHLLADTAMGVLRALPSAPEPANGRPILLACAENEQHSLPLAALAAALAERGLGTRTLGAGLPSSSLAAAVRRTGPAVLLVWAQLPVFADPGLLDQLPMLRPPVSVLAAGAGWLGRPLPARVTYAADLTSACTLVGRAVGA